VSNVILTGKNTTATPKHIQVQFDLSWENSWRNTTPTNNWDAAWVFVKYRVGTGPWLHATLATSGSAAGTGTPTTIQVPTDGLGAFIYRSGNGTGTFDIKNAQLRWNYGTNSVADDAQMEVRVYAIEMVYVPSGNFWVGDGTPETTGGPGGYRASNGGPAASRDAAVEITNSTTFPDGATGEGTGSNNELHNAATNRSGTYPNGFNAYYMMKYPITQIQYVDFLNTLTRTQQNARVAADITTITADNRFAMVQPFAGTPAVPTSPAGATAPVRRNGVRALGPETGADPVHFVCDLNNNGTGNEETDGLHLACNFLNVSDISAYLFWSGQRPMTVMEFEKAARGAGNTPVVGEWVWGGNATTGVGSPEYLASNGALDGSSSEACGSSCGANQVGNLEANLANPDWPQGPVRVGAFAFDGTASNRIKTGAGFYGGMHMGDNVHDFCVNLFDSPTADGGGGRAFNGAHGTGNLADYNDAFGGWPNPTITNATYRGVSIKGSCFFHGNTRRQISRHQILDDSNDPNQSFRANTRRSYFGGRGVRTAP
jgi:formylglycine-generating enzyme required for sulfatase activity